MPKITNKIKIMKNINSIQSAICLMRDILHQAVLKHIECNGPISISKDTLGDTELIDVYDNDGVSRERAIREVYVSNDEIRIVVADIHNGGEDTTIPATDNMLDAVIEFLEYCIQNNE